MKLAILLFTAVTISGLHAGSDREQVRTSDRALSNPIKVEFSGLEEQGVYSELPPVLVGLRQVSRRTAVWVEVSQGSGGETARGTRVKLQDLDLASGRKILNLLDLSEICGEAGIWTLRVMTGSGLSVRSVGEITFEKSHDAEVIRVASPPANGFPAGPGF